LVDQTVEAFYDEGITDVGVIQGSNRQEDWSKPIQVCSVQTLMRRDRLPEADVVIRDEAHRYFKFDGEWMLQESWRNKPFIGLTATPWTKGLGVVYEDLIIGATAQELIDKQWLVPMRVYAPTSAENKPDLSQVRTVAGDYSEKDLAAACNKDRLIADIVATWKDKADGRPTICFAVDRNHADALRTRFNAAGVSAAYMDCKTPLSERKEIQRGFERGEIKVVCNVEVIGIGVDWPSISCISYCRPTKSEIRFVQNIGRGLRPCSGKDELLVLDHSDTHMRLGFVTDIHHEGLSGARLPAQAVVMAKLPKQCPACGYLKNYGVRVCPNCGHKAEPPPPVVENVNGALAEFQGKKKRAGDKWCMAEKAVFLAELKGYALSKPHYKPGWPAAKYRDRLGVWPDPSIRDTPATRTISAATMQWLKSENIKWLHSKRRAELSTERTEVMPDRAAAHAPETEQAALLPGTLMTQQDWEDFR